MQVIEGVWDRLAEALIKYEIDVALDVAKRDSGEICAIARHPEVRPRILETS